jgi:hypothetical protein
MSPIVIVSVAFFGMLLVAPLVLYWDRQVGDEQRKASSKHEEAGPETPQKPEHPVRWLVTRTFWLSQSDSVAKGMKPKSDRSAKKTE